MVSFVAVGLAVEMYLMVAGESNLFETVPFVYGFVREQNYRLLFRLYNANESLQTHGW